MKLLVLEKKHLSDRERLFIETQHNCALCNTELALIITRPEPLSPTHLSEEIQEEATCPHCNIKTRVKNHAIQ
ncbi:MAG: hypothetical protein AABZ31_05320 [Bdellovibrionota bacterium]